MTTPTPSTPALIEQAAWSLLRDGRGQEITQRAIYQAIGSRGSMTTIQQTLAQWWAGLGDHLQALEYLKGFPPEALAPLVEAFAAIRELAASQARDEFEAERRESQEKVETAQTEKTAALEALAMAQAERQGLRQEVEQLVERRDGLERQLRSETDRRQAVEQQIPAIREDARVRIEQAERRAEGLEAALAKEESRHQATETRLTTLYDQERTARAQAHAQAEQVQKTLQGKFEALNETYLQAKQEGVQLAAQLREEVARLTGQIEQLKTAEAQLQAQLGAGQSERAELAASLAEAQADRRHDQARIRDLEQRCATLESACEAKDQEIHQLTAQVAKLHDTQES
ncbi:MAG: DNA-binding protein [Candidatus Thiodiazotropha lotti]